jgi:hypothetical protein
MAVDNPEDQRMKAGPPDGLQSRQDIRLEDKFRGFFIAPVKVLSTFLLVLLFYGAFKYSDPWLWGQSPRVDHSDTAGPKDWNNEIGKGSKYLLGVGKADITG